MFFGFIYLTSCVNYESKGQELIISGEGEITSAGVSSKGNYLDFTIVTINEGPSKIGYLAFASCNNIEKITIPASVTSIQSPFFRMPKLVDIIVSEKNSNYRTDSQGILYEVATKKIIRVPAKQVTIPEGAEIVAKYAFGVGRGFTYDNIILPSTIKDFEEHALNEVSIKAISFASLSQVTYLWGFTWSYFGTLSIPPSCKTISSSAFMSSTFDNIIFEKVSTLEIIEMNAFIDTTINSISLPDSVTTLHQNAFNRCKLTTISIGAMCTDIHPDAFSGCSSLISVDISTENTAYTSIGGMVVNKDVTDIIFIPQGSDNITIPGTITSIGDTLFQSQPKLTNVVFDNNPNWNSIDGVVYSSDFTVLFFVCGGVKKVQAHEKVTKVNRNACYACTNLISFTFKGEKCHDIESYSFYKSGITQFVLPDSVVTIYERAFNECNNLTTFTISNSSNLVTIDVSAFESCKFTSINIGPKVKNIKYRAFVYGKLNCITFGDNSALESIDIDVFYGNKITSLVLPSNLKLLGQGSFGSCSQLSSVSFDEGSQLKTLGQSAFSDCTSLTSIVLPELCETIGMYAFSGCVQLNSFEYTALTSISSSCFMNCVSLKTFKIHLSVTEVSTNSFLGCSQLYSLSVDNGHLSFTEINGVIFDENSTLLYLYPPGREDAFISKSALSFRSNAFEGCLKLRNIIFESGSEMTKFRRLSFYGCSALRSVMFPPMLSTIEEECFSGCSSLSTVYLPHELKTIGNGAFSNCNSLRVVKYCGTNIITGANVFPDTTIKIYVSKYYNSTLLCSNVVEHKLESDCELIFQYSIPKCTYFKPIGFLISILLLIQ